MPMQKPWKASRKKGKSAKKKRNAGVRTNGSVQGRETRRDARGVAPGAPALSANRREALRVTRQARDSSVRDMETKIVLSQSSEQTDTIPCIVNGAIVFQYIWGVLMKPAIGTDRVQDVQNLMRAAVTIYQNFRRMDSVDDPLPRAIVRLRKALEPRTIRGVSYAPVWDGFESSQAAVITAGILETNVGVTMPYPTGAYSNGFGVVTPITPIIPGHDLTAFLGSFASYYDLVKYEAYVEDYSDASAFAFDVGGVHAVAHIASENHQTILAFVGLDSSNNNVTIKQNGIAGLETPMGRRDLAELRACTWVPRQTTGVDNWPPTYFSRRPAYTHNATSIPATIGYSSGKFGLKGRIQLKPVPGTQSCNAFIQRLQNLARMTSPASTAAAWLAGFNPQDIKILAYAWWLNGLRRYSGASFGSRLYANGNIYAPILPEYRLGTSMVGVTRLPQYIAKGLGSIQAATSKYSTLIPWSAQFDPKTLVTTPDVYTNANTRWAGTPTVYNQWSSLDVAQVSDLVLAYKAFEPLLANAENLVKFGELGKSRLGSTLLLALGSNVVCGVVSRDEVTDDRVYDVMAGSPFMSYDQVNVASTGAGMACVFSSSSKEYLQNHRRDFQLGALSSLVAVTYYEGIVTSGFTGNVSGSNQIAQFPTKPLAAPLYKDIPTSLVDKVKELASGLVPTKGNYCGPGWTGGKRGGNSFDVPPSDREDEICMWHDEEYGRAGGDAALIDEADKRMVQRLEDLRRTQGLTMYGHAAKYAINSKRFDPKAWAMRRDEL